MVGSAHHTPRSRNSADSNGARAVPRPSNALRYNVALPTMAGKNAAA